MEEQAKLLADLAAAVSSMKSKLDELHPAVLDLHTRKPEIARSVEPPVLDLHAWKSSPIEKSMEALRVEVGDLRALILDPNKSAATSPTTSLLGVRVAGEGGDGRGQLGGPVSTSDSVTTSGASLVIPDASLMVTIDPTSLGFAMLTRCSTECPDHEANKLASAFAAAMAPTSPTAIVDVVRKLAASAIGDAASMPATCWPGWASSDASAFESVPILSTTTTWSMALEAGSRTAPTPLEVKVAQMLKTFFVIDLSTLVPSNCTIGCLLNGAVDNIKLDDVVSREMVEVVALPMVNIFSVDPGDHRRPPWPPPQWDVLYQPDYSPCVENVLCPWKPRELLSIEKELAIIQPVRRSLNWQFLRKEESEVSCSLAVQLAFETFPLSNDAKEDLAYIVSVKLLQHDKVWLKPWRPPFVCVDHVQAKVLIVDQVHSKRSILYVSEGSVLAWYTCKTQIVCTLLAQPDGDPLCKWISTDGQLHHRLLQSKIAEMHQLITHPGENLSLFLQPKPPWLSNLTQVYTVVEEGGLHPHDKVVTLNSKIFLAALERYVRQLTSDGLLRTLYQEDRYCSCNMLLSEAKLQDDTGSGIYEARRVQSYGKFTRSNHWQVVTNFKVEQLMYHAVTSTTPDDFHGGVCNGIWMEWPRGSGELCVPVDFVDKANSHGRSLWDHVGCMLALCSCELWTTSESTAIHCADQPWQAHSQEGRYLTNQAVISNPIHVSHDYYITFINKISIGYDYYPDQVYYYREDHRRDAGNIKEVLRLVKQVNLAIWPLVVCSRLNIWNCTFLSTPYAPELYAPWDPGGHTPRVFDDGGLRASRMLRRGECHGPCGLRWADARRGLQAQGMRELGDQQLHLKGNRGRTEGASKNQKPNRRTLARAAAHSFLP